MNLSPLHVWASMSMMSRIITVVLLVMALASFAVTIERIIALVRNGTESASFAEKASVAINAWDFAKLVTVAKEHEHSVLARAVAATVARYEDNKTDDGLSPVERAKREATRQLELIGSQLRRGLGVLASVGSVAPFVGLLGTVVGIIAAFQGIAATGSGGLGSVSAGISEALVETALGLCVAIPAVLLFNALSARITSVEGTLGRSLGELLDDLEGHHGRTSKVSSSARKTRDKHQVAIIEASAE